MCFLSLRSRFTLLAVDAVGRYSFAEPCSISSYAAQTAVAPHKISRERNGMKRTTRWRALAGKRVNANVSVGASRKGVSAVSTKSRRTYRPIEGTRGNCSALPGHHESRTPPLLWVARARSSRGWRARYLTVRSAEKRATCRRRDSRMTGRHEKRRDTSEMPSAIGPNDFQNPR